MRNRSRRPLLVALAFAAALPVAAFGQTKPPAPKLPPKPPAQPVQSQPEASPSAPVAPLRAAQELYDDAKFQDAAELLAAAIRDGRVTGDDVARARELRARALAKAGRRVEAQEVWKSLLRSDAAYRADAMRIPPDELAVWKSALKEFQEEQLLAGRRVPASIAFSGGLGNAVNQDLADLASSAGVVAADDFKADPDLGYSVRFPLKPSLSIDFEVLSLRAETEDKLPVTRNAHATYLAKARPFVVSLVRTVRGGPKGRLNGIVGVGPMPGEAIVEYKQQLVAGRLSPSQLIGEKLGWYMHAGLEGEWLVQPRFAITGRVLGRRASSGELDWPEENFEIYESYAISTLRDRSLDFSGIAASIGVRAYIGY